MIYVILANGFEEIEAITVVDVLRRGEIQVKTASLMESKTVYGSKGIVVEADIMFGDIDWEHCNMLVLPGGMPGTTNLCNHYDFNNKLKSFHDKGGSVAAICAAPMVLAKAGILGGQKATIYDGMEGELINCEYTGEDVTVSGNIITGRGPGLAMDFALKIVETVKGREVMEQVMAGLLYEKEI